VLIQNCVNSTRIFFIFILVGFGTEWDILYSILTSVCVYVSFYVSVYLFMHKKSVLLQ